MKFYYKCDKKFHLEDLIKLYNDNGKKYAIVLISGKVTYFYQYTVNNTKLLKTITQDIPNKHKTGGQSAQRFERIRDGSIKQYSKKILEIMIQLYTSNGNFDYTGLILAGPAEMKNIVIDHDLFSIFKDHVSCIHNISEITDNSISQVVSMSIETIDSDNIDSIKEFENKLQNPIKTNLFVFGSKIVLKLFRLNRLSDIYITSDYYDIETILENRGKCSVHYMDPILFKKYGDIVGVKYYEYDYNDEYDYNY